MNSNTNTNARSGGRGRGRGPYGGGRGRGQNQNHAPNNLDKLFSVEEKNSGEKMDVLRKEIEVWQEKLAACRKELDGKDFDRRKIQNSIIRAKELFRKNGEEFSAKEKIVESLQEQMNANQQADRAKSNEKNHILSGFPEGVNLNQDLAKNYMIIDQKIRSLEEHLSTTNLDLRQEKRVISEIADLNRSKVLVAELSKKNDSVQNATKTGYKSLRDNLRNAQWDLNQLKGKEAVFHRQLSGFREKLLENQKKLPELIKQRTKCHEEIKKIVIAMNEERKALSEVKMHLYQKQQKTLAEEKARGEKRWQERQEQWKKRDEERKIELEEYQATLVPYSQEMDLCDDLINYVKSLFPSSEIALSAAAAAAAEAPASTPVDDAKGHFHRKDNIDDENCSKSRKGKNKRGRGRKNQTKSNQELKHKLGSFVLFEKLKVKSPLFADDLPKCLAELETKKKHFSDLSEKEIKEIKAKNELKLEKKQQKLDLDEKKEQKTNDNSEIDNNEVVGS